jgi:hypothetical protein
LLCEGREGGREGGERERKRGVIHVLCVDQKGDRK